MANIANPVNTVAITNDTVGDVVGLCYFDPVTESLIEISDIPNHFLTVQPFEQVIRKYYAVVSPGQVVDYIKVKIPKDGMEDLYSIKVIISQDNPSADSFAGIPDFNSFRLNNPVAGDFVPVWVLVSSKTPVNEIINISIELEYEGGT
jgi:hypothetical protein